MEKIAKLPHIKMYIDLIGIIDKPLHLIIQKESLQANTKDFTQV